MSQPEGPDVPVVPQLPAVPDTPAPVTPPASAPAEKEELEAPAPLSASVSAPRIDAVAIAEMCQLAGQAELTAGFLARGATEADVRKSLLASRADSVEIRSTLSPDSTVSDSAASSTPHVTAASNPMLSAVRKLTGKV